MARCCSGTNQVAMLEGAHIIIEGTGTPGSPFVITSDVDLRILDTENFNLGLAGFGTAEQPWILSVNYATTAKLANLPDVDADAPTNGQVMAWNAVTQTWVATAPVTAPTGAVVHDTSLTGDGSAGSPLQVRESTEGWLATVADGLTLSSDAINSTIRKFADANARALADPVPEVNSVSMLETEPGRQDYWTGTEWRPVVGSISLDANAQLLAMSGDYSEGTPFTTVVRRVNAVTDEFGQFEVFTPADLTGRAGVLIVDFQEGGTVPFKALINPDFNRIMGTAYRLEDGAPLVGQEISGFARAQVY